MMWRSLKICIGTYDDDFKQAFVNFLVELANSGLKVAVKAHPAGKWLLRRAQFDPAQHPSLAIVPEEELFSEHASSAHLISRSRTVVSTPSAVVHDALALNRPTGLFSNGDEITGFECVDRIAGFRNSWPGSILHLGTRRQRNAPVGIFMTTMASGYCGAMMLMRWQRISSLRETFYRNRDLRVFIKFFLGFARSAAAASFSLRFAS